MRAVALTLSLLLTGVDGLSVQKESDDELQWPLFGLPGSIPNGHAVDEMGGVRSNAPQTHAEQDASMVPPSASGPSIAESYRLAKEAKKKQQQAVPEPNRFKNPATGQWEECPSDDSFFHNDLALHVERHPEFSGHGLRMGSNQGNRYFAVDSPWSPEVHRISQDMDMGPAGNVTAQGLNFKVIEDPEAFRRRTIRERKKWTEARIEDAKDLVEKQLVTEHALKGETFEKMGVWYFNMDKAVKRKECLEHQLNNMKVKVEVNRFAAIQFPARCVANVEGKDVDPEQYEQCLKEEGLGDCIEGGIDYAATETHGSEERSPWEIRSAVLSNWCGHKRLWRKLEQDMQDPAKRDSVPKYLVFLEDDVILDREYFLSVVRDFASNYKERDWDLVQIDPFGGKAKDDFIGQWRGKPVFKPAAGDCSKYWGFHAVLVKTEALPRINSWMSANKALPIDWLPWTMPDCLAFSGLVARNPEARLFGKIVVLPQFCSEEVQKTTIG